MTRRLVALAAVVAFATTAAADPDPKRKVIVLEYRSGSSALTGIAKTLLAQIQAQTSLQLLGPDQTRTQYGGSLDQDVVTCAGDAACIAAIGAKVGATDVLLVGISELGDVILTVQRIEVRKKAAVTRIADSLATGATPTDDQIDGYLARLLAPSDFIRFGVIDIVANLAGASVTVGGERRGVTPIEALKLHAPATYSIRVEKTGYVPFSTKVALPPDGEIKVEAELSRRGSSAWYQKWYVLAGAGLFIAGGAGTAIYFGTREDHNTVPVTGTY
jgi:hypothetical protein